MTIKRMMIDEVGLLVRWRSDGAGEAVKIYLYLHLYLCICVFVYIECIRQGGEA